MMVDLMVSIGSSALIGQLASGFMIMYSRALKVGDFVTLPWRDLLEMAVRLRDRLGPAVYDRPGNDLLDRGLYLDLPAWGYHVFEVRPDRG